MESPSAVKLAKLRALNDARVRARARAREERGGSYHIHPRAPYPLWVCPKCGFAVASNVWSKHRRACEERLECAVCRRVFPCRARTCKGIDREHVEVRPEWPGKAPRKSVLYSLKMHAELRRGLWFVWFRGEAREDVKGEATWEDGYWAAIERASKK